MFAYCPILACKAQVYCVYKQVSVYCLRDDQTHEREIFFPIWTGIKDC